MMLGTNIARGWDWQYIDLTSIQEVQITGTGASAEYGNYTGAVANVIIKSGGNTFEGMAELTHSSFGWNSKNFSESDPNFSLYKAPPRSRWRDFSLGIGGPIIKDKFWFFASAAYVQTDEEVKGYDEYGTFSDPKFLLKLTMQPGINDRLTLLGEGELWRYNNYLMSAQRPPEATTDSIAPGYLLGLTWFHTFSKNTFAEVKLGYYWCNTEFEPYGGLDKSQWYDERTGMYSGNYGTVWWEKAYHYYANVSMSHFADDFLGSHEFKLGIEYVNGYSDTGYYATNGYSYTIDLYGNVYAESFSSKSQAAGSRATFFALDSWKISERLTFNPGVRYSINRGSLPQRQDEPLFKPSNTIEPRIGFTWDILGDHTTALKVHYGRYVDSFKTLYFSDADVASDDWVLFRVTPDDTFEEIYRVAYTNPTTIDADIKMPYSDQFTIGLERTLMKDVVVGASFVYREYKKFIGTVNSGATWTTVPFTFTDETGAAQTIDVYRKTSSYEADRFIVTNPEAGKYSAITTPLNKYTGLHLFFEKRFSNNWMLHVAYSYGQTKGNHPNSAGWGPMVGYLNPNNFINAQGHLSIDPTHYLQAYGTFSLPLGFNFSPRFRLRSGNPWTRGIIVSEAEGRPTIRIEPRGSQRLPFGMDLDFRFEKSIRLTGRMRLNLIADFFNIFNQGVNTSVLNNIESINYKKATDVNAPRYFRLGLRFKF